MASLNRGETKTLVLRASYHGVETAAPSGVATWSVSDPAVGTVTPITQDGLKAKFFALSGGSCEITATLGSLVAKQSVEVRGEADALEILIEGETTPGLPATSAVILLEPISRLFPADNWWNVDVSAAPVDP